MAECEYIAKCLFFNGKMANVMPNIVESIKKRYCLGDNSSCARYIVCTKLGREAVPDDLVPNKHDIANRILEQARQKQSSSSPA